ncbi:MAG: FecR domain-containing protein, partial [Ignavibacteriales bacterium]|nr:FecR domain-containing protein [Ignavibacteriales bacterium]
QSLKERKAGNWEKSFQQATLSKQEANNAYQEASMKNSTKGEASVTFAKGNVEGKKPAESLWKALLAMAKLLENDKIRTLSSSYAEISFIDKSKIRLSENSQAVIQRNRVDLLRNANEAKVSLEKGDAFALLSGGQGKRKFNLEVPGLETTVRSKAYWVNRDEKTTKVANYDGEIELKSKASKVTLKSNQGSSMLADGKLTAPKDLLKQPVLFAPSHEFTVYASSVTLQWEATAKASKYWLMIANDPSFKTILTQLKDITATSKKIDLEKGIYYWRVAAIDADGFPGPFSESRSFTQYNDNEPPYIGLSEPSDSSTVIEKILPVKGTTESNVKISVNGTAVTTNENSGFATEVSLQPGKNIVVVEAVDLNGNKTTIKRNVKYTVPQETFIDFILQDLPVSNGIVYAPAGMVSIRGASLPFAAIEARINPAGTLLRSTADSTGIFMLNVGLVEEAIELQCTATGLEGKTSQKTLKIVRDRKLPAISFKDDFPFNTSDENLVVIGRVENVVKLTMNGKQQDIKENGFQVVLILKEGRNTFDFEALNENGNKVNIFREVVLDTKPPELGAYSVKPSKNKNLPMLQFEVKAADTSGLKKTVKVIYELGDDMITVYLKWDEASNSYRGTAYVSNANPAEAFIRVILLEAPAATDPPRSPVEP